jgi:hypothetical protein
MDIDKLTNSTVKAAFDALQTGDSELWLSYFTPDALLYDDGNVRDFHSFSTKNVGHKKFTSIDKVQNEGLDIYGHFHSDQWGDFKTYFKFHINGSGAIYRLDIGQTNY